MVKVDFKGSPRSRRRARLLLCLARRPAVARRTRLARIHGVLQRSIEEHRTPDKTRFAVVVTDYKASDDYKKPGASTQAQWGKWLDRIGQHFGELGSRNSTARKNYDRHILRWRNKWADTPAPPIMRMQVLSRVLAHAVDLGKIAGNPCEGIKQLYSE